MVKIETTTRVIRVKETLEEVVNLMGYHWVSVTEDTSFYGELSGKIHELEREIKINRDHIITYYKD